MVFKGFVSTGACYFRILFYSPNKGLVRNCRKICMDETLKYLNLCISGIVELLDNCNYSGDTVGGSRHKLLLNPTNKTTVVLLLNVNCSPI